jgi:hypothetical protein
MHLRAFAFEEAEHIEVAVAFGELRPELADDLDHGLHTRVIDLDFTQAAARLPHLADELRAVEMIQNLARCVEKAQQLRSAPQRRGQPGRHTFQNLESPAGFEEMAQPVHHFFKGSIGASRNRLEWADAIAEVVEDIAQVEHIERAQVEVQRELQAGIVGCGLDGLLGLVEHDAESLIAGVLQRQPVLRFIHAEAAGTAGAGGEKNILFLNLVARIALIFQRTQKLDEVADCEIGGIALAVIAEFPAKGEGLHIRSGQHLAAITAGAQNGLDEALMLPGEAAEEDRHLVPLLGGEGPLRGAVIMPGLAALARDFDQPLLLRRDARSRPLQRRKGRTGEVVTESHG